MNILPIVKLGAGIVSSFGAGAVVGNAIKATTPDSLKKTTKILVTVGGFIVAAAVGDLASDYVENSLQGAYDGVQSAKNKAKRVDTDGIQDAAEDLKDAGERIVKETKKAAEEVVKEDKPETDASI